MCAGHLLLLIVMNALWAGTYSAFKGLAPHLDPGALVTLRYSVAAVLLAVSWPWLPGPAPQGRDWVWIAVMGVIVFCLGPRLQVAGVQLGEATDAAVLMALEPLVTSIAAAIFLRERIGPRRWTGFSLGVAGVLLMAEVWRPGFCLPGLWAHVLFLSSFVCEAAYSVMGKPLLHRVGTVRVVALALVAGSLANWVWDGTSAWVAAQGLPPKGWSVVLYLSVLCTVVGYVAWFVVIRDAPVNVAAMTVFLQPVLGVLIAAATLGERPRWGHLWGGLVILTGVGIGLSRQIQRGRIRSALKGWWVRAGSGVQARDS
ncbi:MAG: DMT family transporter [Verrucomicrobiota bacterium]|nr:DMT family transporter [Limisphaera sp.]MDW8382575.1 DMT family transporter [Verrucomicrobiota bacterium]